MWRHERFPNSTCMTTQDCRLPMFPFPYLAVCWVCQNRHERCSNSTCMMTQDCCLLLFSFPYLSVCLFLSEYACMRLFVFLFAGQHITYYHLLLLPVTYYYLLLLTATRCYWLLHTAAYYTGPPRHSGTLPATVGVLTSSHNGVLPPPRRASLNHGGRPPS